MLFRLALEVIVVMRFLFFGFASFIAYFSFRISHSYAMYRRVVVWTKAIYLLSLKKFIRIKLLKKAINIRKLAYEPALAIATELKPDPYS